MKLMCGENLKNKIPKNKKKLSLENFQKIKFAKIIPRN